MMTIYIHSNILFIFLLFININMAMMENGHFDETILYWDADLQHFKVTFTSSDSRLYLILINIERSIDIQGGMSLWERVIIIWSLKNIFILEVLMMSEKKLLKTMSWRFLHCGTLIHDGFLIMFSFKTVYTHQCE